MATYNNFLCKKNQKFELKYLHQILGVLSRKFAMKECIFSASICIETFANLIQILNNYEGTKCNCFQEKHFPCFKQIIAKNNDFASPK